VPTKKDILVPETVLKKRKSQEKEREQRAADLKKKRDVSHRHVLPISFVMKTYPSAARPQADVASNLNIIFRV
jgi:Zn-dependent peptidase ImmA (M78 family)